MIARPRTEELFEQGRQRLALGDRAGAEAAWRIASRGGHHEAALYLGELLAGRGDFEGAADELAYAVGDPDPAISIPAVIRYGRLICELEFKLDIAVGWHRTAKSIRRDVAEADRLWRLAAESEHRDAAWAWLGLGRLNDPLELADRAGPDRSKEAFRHAAASGHVDAAPCAQFKLGRLHRHLGERDEAIAALMAAATSDHPEWAARAAFDLAGIYADDGDAEQAEHWWRMVFESGNPTLLP